MRWKMRRKTLKIRKSIIVSAIAYNIYYISPLNDPIDIDKIMNHVNARVTERCVDSTVDMYSYICFDDVDDFKSWLDNMLMSCSEFKNLNLTKREREMGIDVDDENRQQIAFTSLYNDIPYDDNFVDLDACLQNIVCHVVRDLDTSSCFLCDHMDDEEYCNTCTLNERYSNKYEHKNTPFNTDKFDGWCKYDCYKSIAVGCLDCDEYETCDHKCTESCETCENFIRKES